MSELANLPNVGRVLENNLIEVGIKTPEELRKIGTKETFLMIRKKVDPGACIHMLYGLEGAIEGIKDTELNNDTRNDLKEFFNRL